MRIVLPLIVLLAGCQNLPAVPGLGAHKVDIQQGNYVTQDMLEKLKPGMTRSQVRFALGTPLVIDPFHADRWDYVYVSQKRGRVIDKQRVVVVFQDDKLLRIEGEGAPPRPATVAPSKATAKAAPASPRPEAAKPADAAAVPVQ